MKNKKTYIIIGVVAVIGIGLFLYNRNKKGVEKRSAEAKEDDLSKAKEDDLSEAKEDVKNDKPKAVREKIASKLTKIDSAMKILPSISQTPEKPNTYRMGYIAFRPNGFHAVMLDNRPPKGTIRANDNVKITGTSFDGTYKVSSVFIDSSNRVGGVFIPIKYTPTGREDRTFQRIGLIEIV